MKTVLITGANSGFGYLTALQFARNGYFVYATTRSLEKEGVNDLNAIAQKESLKVKWLVLDVTDDNSVKEAISGIKDLDVLVNNAGYGAIGSSLEFSSDDFLQQLNTNVVGIHRMIKALVNVMKKGGKIINISSIAGRVSFTNYSLYSASKHAVRAYSQSLRQELYSKGIDVAIVEPGSFETNFGKNIVSLKSEEKSSDRLNNKINKYKKIFVNWGLMPLLNKPEQVSKKIYKLSQKDRMPFNNLVGVDAKIISFYNKWIPIWLWNKLMDIIAK